MNNNVYDRLGCQREYLERFFEHSKGYAWEADGEGRYTFVSRNVEILTGFSASELIGRHVLEMIPEPDAQHVEKAFRESIRKRQTHHNLVHRVKKKGGGHIWVGSTALMSFDHDGVFSGARSIAWDITEQKEAENELSERENEYRYMFEHTQVGMVVTSGDGVILNANKIYADIFGWPVEQMVGKEIKAFYPEPLGREYQEKFQRDFEAIKKTPGKMVNFGGNVARVDHRDGTRHVKFFPFAVKIFKNGQVVGMMHTVMDITAAVAAEEKIRRYQEKLENMVRERTRDLEKLREEFVRQERLATLGKLTATVSHEIRNPLGTISSSLYVIAERVKDAVPGVEKSIKRAERAIRRCDGIIEELLDYTRSSEIQKETVLLDDWLGAVLDELPTADNIQFIKALGFGCRIGIDPDKFRRVIVNLVKNALQAFAQDATGRITVKTVAEGAYLVLSIQDTGRGIPPAHREKVFEPLFSTKSFGVGLGLPICKQIVELHGGHIEIDSAPDVGTNVRIRLPIAVDGCKAPA